MLLPLWVLGYQRSQGVVLTTDKRSFLRACWLQGWVPLPAGGLIGSRKASFRTSSCCSVAQSGPTLHNPTDYSPSGSSVHGILQARTLERVAMPFSRSSRSRDQTHVSCTGRQVLHCSATREAQDPQGFRINRGARSARLPRL